MEKLWTPGENGAHHKIDVFIKEGLANYKDGRNFPSGNNVSQLSPHLHFGEVSPTKFGIDQKPKKEKRN